MINANINCEYPCIDINQRLVVPKVDLNPDHIKMIMISESPSNDVGNYFYNDVSAPFFRTTQIAFGDAGVEIKNYNDLTNMGIYLTTAIKCPKVGYLVTANTIKNCTAILAIEIDQFSNIKAIMCMGDFAIKAINYIYKNKTGVKPIKSGSTYKIRDEVYEQDGIRFFPSYTQTGDSFNIEKSKRKMIAEDIANALQFVN